MWLENKTSFFVFASFLRRCFTLHDYDNLYRDRQGVALGLSYLKCHYVVEILSEVRWR